MYSTNQLGRDEAQSAKQILMDLEQKGKMSKDPKEQDYVSCAIALIRTSERSLQTIIESRNLNFKEANALREQSQQNILYYSQFTGNLQSLVPRLGSMTVAGVGGGITLADLFNKVFPALGDYTLPLIIAIGAAIGYLVHGLIVVPIVKRKLQMENVKGDYDRNLYYDQYIERTKNALIGLYIALENCHTTYFEQKYNQSGDASQIVKGVLQGVYPTLCPYVHKHMREGRITPDLWSKCETGQGITYCPLWEGEK